MRFVHSLAYLLSCCSPFIFCYPSYWKTENNSAVSSSSSSSSLSFLLFFIVLFVSPSDGTSVAIEEEEEEEWWYWLAITNWRTLVYDPGEPGPIRFSNRVPPPDVLSGESNQFGHVGAIRWWWSRRQFSSSDRGRPWGGGGIIKQKGYLG